MVIHKENPHTYSITDQLWEDSFDVLRAYMEIYKKEPNSDEIYEGVAIGKWLANQRLNYDKATFLPYREARLSKIGVPVSSSKWDLRWKSQLDAYQSFILEYGTVYIEKGTEHQGIDLHWWAVRQRQKRRRDGLSAEKIQDLNALGFVWDAFASSWKKDIKLYASFIDEYRREPEYHEIYKDFRIGVWFSLQKTRYRSGIIHKYKVDQLESIGIVWDK